VSRGAHSAGKPKACRRCGQTQPVTAFRNPRMHDGVASWCRQCHLVGTQRWRAENRERINLARREQYALEHGEVRPYRRKPLYVYLSVEPGPGTGDKSTIVTPAPAGADE